MEWWIVLPIGYQLIYLEHESACSFILEAEVEDFYVVNGGNQI